MSAEHQDNAKLMITDVFVKGAVHGWKIATGSTIPNVIMAFVLIKILKQSGILDLIGQALDPVMGIFGLSGAAATALLGAWMSMGGGVGVTVALFEEGAINGTQIAILTPAIFLMGSQIQYLGRCFGVIGIKGKDIVSIMVVPVITAVISLFVMRLIVMGS